ncbi:ribonuclease E/G [Staphylococcus epidermidis]|nr:ribonuclease E/G [Staphylococcus epidermidis]
MENRLRDALRQDRARVQFGTISKFGLMEMSRQRLKPAAPKVRTSTAHAVAAPATSATPSLRRCRFCASFRKSP